MYLTLKCTSCIKISFIIIIIIIVITLNFFATDIFFPFFLYNVKSIQHCIYSQPSADYLIERFVFVVK